MREQLCIVQNKSQLIVAFKCAKDYPFVTRVVLEREGKSDLEWILRTDWMYHEYAKKGAKLIYTSLGIEEQRWDAIVKSRQELVHIKNREFQACKTYEARMSKYNNQINRAISIIRKIPAEAFK